MSLSRWENNKLTAAKIIQGICPAVVCFGVAQHDLHSTSSHGQCHDLMKYIGEASEAALLPVKLLLFFSQHRKKGVVDGFRG